ncbi:MAG TPA: archease [bacterium]|nr:archease [bacterium]
MKKFEILDHTADIKAIVYGLTEESLFENAAELLYCLMSLDCKASEEKEETEIKLSADTLENLIVKFLNELIYHVEVRKKAGKLSFEKLRMENRKWHLACRMAAGTTCSPEKEIKAATYHGLRIDRKKGIMSLSIIFDV